MARLTFRQGIVRHGKSPGQAFFLEQNGNYVNLVISPELTIIALADGTKDYLYTEAATQLQVWGPFISAQDYWLYWDINKVSGIRTFGFIAIAPSINLTPPPSPQPGQMWFDTSTNNVSSGKMHEFNGSSWVPVLRVFACKYNSGQFFSPVNGSIAQNQFTGSQVGAYGNVTRNIGSLAFDASGKPIVNQDGKFFTTEDVFTTGVPTGASLKVNNILLRAQSIEPIASYQVVVFDDYNRIRLATPFDFLDKVYGIVEENVVTDDVGNVIMEGIIYNEQWDFSDVVNNPNMAGVINDPIYVTNTGELTTNINISIPGQVPLGAIVGVQSIIFRPGLYGSSGFGSVNDHGNLTGLGDDDHPQYLNPTRGDLQYYPRVTADLIFAQITHPHVRADITDFAHLHVEADIQNLDKYTQAEIDGLLANRVARSGDTMSGMLILSGNPVNALDAVTKQYADAIAAGIATKESVAVATVTDISGIYNPTAGTGGTGGFTSVDISNIDGIRDTDYDFNTTNRILIKNQINAKQNGIYIITNFGTGIADAVLERSPDHDGSPVAEVSPGNYAFINGGLAQSGGGWVVLAGTATGPNDTIILNTDDMNWSAVSSATSYSGDGVTINIDAGTDVISVIPASTGGQVNALTWNGQSYIGSGSSPQLDEILLYNGTNWVNSYLYTLGDAGAGESLITVPSGISDIDISGNANVNIVSAVTANITSLNTILTSTANTTITAGNNVLVFNSGNSSTTLQTDSFTISPFTGGNDANIVLQNNVGSITTLSVNSTSFIASIFSFPPTNGNLNEVLLTDGSGITSWGSVPAASVNNIPSGNISSTDVQSAINELDGDVTSLAIRVTQNETDIVAITTQAPNGSTHVQSTASTTWSFFHNKNSRNFVYTVLDASFNQIIPDSASAADLNTFVITFSTAIIGQINMVFYNDDVVIA